MDIDPFTVFYHFYPDDTPLRRLLLKHSLQVKDKALFILRACKHNYGIDKDIAEAAALLHDIGVGRCHAPSILCNGSEPYLTHGVIGAALLRGYGVSCGRDMEIFARVCERHTGSGITAHEIREQHLPLPEIDLLPETATEKLICLADKFFSKSGDMEEKPLPRVRASLVKFGQDSLTRFDSMCEMFELAVPS